METLGEVRKRVAKFVGSSGACAQDEEVVTAINEVRSILYPLGDWNGTTDLICIKPYCGLITLPPVYDYAKTGMMSCEKIIVNNEWFTFLESQPRCRGHFTLHKQHGEYVTFRDWPCEKENKDCARHGFRLKLVFESEDDFNTRIVFFGRGPLQHEIKIERRAESAFQKTLPQGGEQPLFSLTRVVKPKTKGRIRVYGYSGQGMTPTNEFLLAIYEPGWVNPTFTRYRSRNHAHGIVLKAKKKYLPLPTDDDDQPVDINTNALIHGLQAIADRDAKQPGGYTTNLRLAVDFLNRELHGPESTSTAAVQMSTAYRVEGLYP